MSTKPGRRTRMVHAGTRRSGYGEMSEAIYLTQGFAYESAEAAEARFIEAGPDEFIYARYGNPTVRMFEERMAALEGTEDAFATASGMAAVSAALMAGLKAGDRVVAARALFGSCEYILGTILPRYGVDVRFVDGTDMAAWEAALSGGAEAVFVEAVSNPTLEVIDLEALRDLARRAGARMIVDNALLSPVFSAATRAGADLVVYSATKHVDGQGRCLGGVVLGARDLIRKIVEPYVKHTGSALSPFNAWVLLKGLETIELRVRAQAGAAQALAQALSGHAALARILYPHHPDHPQHALARRLMESGGTLVSIDFKGGKEAAFRFMNALQHIEISNNFADAKSIVTHPATTTHQRLSPERRAELGISDGLVRISLGLEDPMDLIADVMQALEGL